MKQLRFYRISKEYTGCAVAFELSYKENNKYDKYQAFLMAAKQANGDDANGNAKFDWDNGITVKLGENDLFEILSVLEGRKESVGTKGSLFHQTPGGGNKSIGLQEKDNGFFLSISAQNKEKTEVKKVFMNLSHSEASGLCVLIKKTIERIFEW